MIPIAYPRPVIEIKVAAAMKAAPDAKPPFEIGANKTLAGAMRRH